MLLNLQRDPLLPMKYAVYFSVLGIAICLLGAALGGWAWLALWPGLSFLAVGIAYGLRMHGVWGKLPRGSVSPIRVAVLAPYSVPLWMVWHLYRVSSREKACDLVIPGSGRRGPVWIGRWPFLTDVPPNTAMIVDLLAEWPARPAVIRERVYRSLPVLDGCPPANREAFLALVEEVAEHAGTTYIHCAMGHGRSGLLAAAVLMKRGLAADADEAVRMIRECRSGVGLSKAQLAFLREVSGDLSGSGRSCKQS